MIDTYISNYTLSSSKQMTLDTGQQTFSDSWSAKDYTYFNFFSIPNKNVTCWMSNFKDSYFKDDRKVRDVKLKDIKC